MNNEEKIKNISDVLLNLLNENINQRLTPTFCEGILTVFYRNLKKIIESEEKEITQENK